MSKVALAGGPPTTLVTGLSFAMSLTVDASSVYWCDFYQVAKVSIGGGGWNKLAPAVSCKGIAMDAATVFFVHGSGSATKVSVNGGAAVDLAAGQKYPYAIAVDAASVWWTDYTDGTIRVVDKGGGAAATLWSGQANPCTIAVDGTSVYWGNCGTFSVMKLAK